MTANEYNENATNKKKIINKINEGHTIFNHHKIQKLFSD